MIPVDLITETELDKRFDALPDKLKEALTSDRNLTIIDQVCQKNRIADEDKKETIQQIAALVLFGFVHPYDAGAEINDALLLNNPRFSASVADELNAKIFAPLKTELENNYHPPAGTSADIVKEPAAKNKIQVPAPKIISQAPALMPAQPIVKVAGPTTVAKPAPPPAALPLTPPPVSSPTGPPTGWSRSTPNSPW